MKKILTVLVALSLVASLAVAAPAKKADKKSDKKTSTALTPLVAPGDLVANVGIGWGGVSGGVELGLAQVDIANILPITFGVAARANVDPGLFLYNFLAFGVGGFGTAHVGFKDLNLPDNLHWLSNVDSYAGIGLGFASLGTYGSGLGISTFEGVSYYLNENFAIGFEYGYLGASTSYYSYTDYYSTIGVTLKL